MIIKLFFPALLAMALALSAFAQHILPDAPTPKRLRPPAKPILFGAPRWAVRHQKITIPIAVAGAARRIAYLALPWQSAISDDSLRRRALPKR